MADPQRKWALVTGATGGLGRAFAQGLARRGYSLVLSARHADALEALAGDLRSAHGVEVVTQTADLGEPGAAQALKSAVDSSGIAIETLINNAGFAVHGRFADQAADRVTGMVDVNIRALTELTHLYAGDMASRGGGHILLVSSTGAFQPIPGYAVYAASKAYVLSFGRALHKELRRRKVVVTVLCPGPTATGFFTAAGHSINALAAAAIMQPEPVADIGLKALYAGKRDVVAGLMNRLTAFSTRFIPTALLVMGAGYFMGNRK